MFELLSMLKKKNPNAVDYMNQAFRKIFKFDNICDFRFDSNLKSIKSIDELISLDYKDYVEAMKIILKGLS